MALAEWFNSLRFDNCREDAVNVTACTPLRTKIFRWVVARLLNWLFRIRIEGRENIPTGGYIVYANHTSWVDTPLLLTTLPAEPRAYVIGEAKGLRALWKRAILWLVGCVITFDRHSENREIFSKPVEVLRAGAVLALFPGGWRSDEEGVVTPFRRGIGHFALQANVGLLPVALSGAYDLYWQKEIVVRIGKRFRVNVEGLEERAAVDMIVHRAEDELRAILPPYVEPVVATKRMRWLKDKLN